MVSQDALYLNYHKSIWQHRQEIDAALLLYATPAFGALTGDVLAQAANGNLARIFEAFNQTTSMPPDLAPVCFGFGVIAAACLVPLETAELHMYEMKQALRGLLINFPGAPLPVEYTTSELILNGIMKPLYDRSPLPQPHAGL